MIRLYLLAASCIFVFGCGSTTPASPKLTKPDPLAAFKKIVETGIHRAKESPVVVRAVDDEWAKWQTAISDPTYDVKKSDSLLSPFSAVISVKEKTLRSELFATQTQAQDANNLTETTESLYELEYGFQNEEWIIKSARFRYFSIVTGKDSGWVDHPLSRKGEGVVAFFWPENQH